MSQPMDRGRKYYEFERTTVTACHSDPRFSYCLYVPERLIHDTAGVDIVVAMHGTGRTFVAYRDAFSAFGRWNDCIIVCPLFPVGVLGDGNRSGFKYIVEGDIRYDRVLLSIVDEVRARYGIEEARFGLFGYSGGAHFAHRMLLLHPRRLWAVSVGAPGSVTRLDQGKDWWVGVRDLEAKFGIQLDLDAMRQVPAQIVVGAADLESWEITHQEGGRYWMPGANDAGATRPERARALASSLESHGIRVRLDIVPNMAHDGLRAIPVAETFLKEALDRKRAT
jgi:pimeloyl-ACP methyl ester carboxylesterase